VAYRLQAGNRAHRMSAYREAVVHLNRGLAQLPALPAGPERTQLELALQTSLANVLVVAQGYASPHVQRAFGRARELSRALGDPPLAIPVLYGLAVYRFVRADLRQAYDEAQAVLQSLQQAGVEQDGYVLGCQLVLGAASLHRGQLALARQHLEAVVQGYDPPRHRDLAYQLGHDPAVGAWSYLSFVLWQQGFPQQAQDACDNALELAHNLDHPYSQGYAASFAAMLRQMLRQGPECQARAGTALRLGREGHFPLWQAIGGLTHGWALAYQGHPDEGIVEVAQGLATWEHSGAALALPYQRALLAGAFLAAGARDKGLQALEGSFCCPQERWWLPEQHRLRAELLLLAPGNETEAEASLRHALALAGQHQAHSLELRAATSLARLLARQGRVAEGRKLLSRSYSWFQEGLQTPDLVEARQLLDRMQPAGNMMATTATVR
jgi:tetratricopeptide (TPR) repeat protein